VKVQQNNHRYFVTLFTSIFRGRLFYLLLFILSSTAAAQDNALSRVSVAERSDGKGYVIRYHLSEEADSFRVYQPVTDLIQMTLYGTNIDTSNIAVPAPNKVIDEISFYEIPEGIGVDFYISEGTYFKARAYADGSSNDLLLGLAYTSLEDLESYTAEIEPIIWSRLSDSTNSLLVDVSGAEVSQASYADTGYEIIKNKMRFDVVVIDPGHGGHDPGSIGYKGVEEEDITLSISKKLGAYIEEYLPDVKVVYTRDDDTFVELEERGSIANRAEGDLFVSIHCNSHRSTQPYGTEVYFLGLEKSKAALETMKRENSVIRLEDGDSQDDLTPGELLIYELANSGYIATSEKVAGMIEHQFKNRAQRRSRGVKQARFMVLYHASMPAILVETGFISNPSEQRYLSSDYGQSIIASAIFRAIRDYKEQYDKSQHYNTN
jgi:N-acetylmuramoyl-L-alanine amidase